MTYTQEAYLTWELFLEQYRDHPRYELADGELIDMEPTGPHETVSGKLATQLGIAILAAKLPWFIPQGCFILKFSRHRKLYNPKILDIIS